MFKDERKANYVVMKLNYVVVKLCHWDSNAIAPPLFSYIYLFSSWEEWEIMLIA